MYSVLTLFIVKKKGKITMEKLKLGPQTLLYPMPAVLVGAMVGEKPNFMTAAWCGIAASNPPAISVALQKIRIVLPVKSPIPRR